MKNHHTKTACATGALTLALAMPTLPDSEHQVARQMLSEADRIAIFGEDSNFQVALLTDEEMAETKGALYPFVGYWAGRIVWGVFYGAASWAYDNHLRPHGGIPPSLSSYILMHSIAQLLSTHYLLGTAVGFASEKAGGPRAIDNMKAAIRTKMIEAEWTFRDVLERIGDATDRMVAEHLRRQERGGGGADSLSVNSASGSSDTGRYLLNLTDRLDRASLQQFFSNDVPEVTLRIILNSINPRGTSPISRRDFLENLPRDTVNRVVLELPEALMARFLDIVPQTLQNDIRVATGGNAPSDSTTTLDVHWMY